MDVDPRGEHKKNPLKPRMATQRGYLGEKKRSEILLEFKSRLSQVPFRSPNNLRPQFAMATESPRGCGAGIESYLIDNHHVTGRRNTRSRPSIRELIQAWMKVAQHAVG